MTSRQTIREVKNRSGSISVQIIERTNREYKVVKTIGSAKDETTLAILKQRAEEFIANPNPNQKRLFSQSPVSDGVTLSGLTVAIDKLSVKVRTVGPDIILGTLFDRVGLNQVSDPMFRHLVLSRLRCTPLMREQN